jgi:hypothetical protein
MGSSWRPENTDSIALYLVLDDVVVAGDEAAVFAQATFSLLDQRSREPVYTSTTTNVFSAARRVWGYERFIKRRDLEQSSGVLKDDRFAIRVQVKVFYTGILKISVVTDKREYRIYQKFIGDINKILKEI